MTTIKSLPLEAFMHVKSIVASNFVRLFMGAMLLASAQAAMAAPPVRSNALATDNRAMTPRIEKAACYGWGPFCPPGWVRSCGLFACRCRPCFY